MKPVYSTITPLSSPWPATRSCSFLIPVLVPHVSGQGKRRAARHSLVFFPKHLAASILGLRTQSCLLLILRHGPCFPYFCNALSLPGNRRARRGFYRVSSSISSGLAILLPIGFIWVYRCVPGFQIGSKWAVLHKMAFSDPYGFHSLAVIRKQILCNLFSQSTGLGSMDYSLWLFWADYSHIRAHPPVTALACGRLHLL